MRGSGACSEVQHFEFLLTESGADGEECCRNMASRVTVVGAIRSVVNARSLQMVCVCKELLDEDLLVLTLTYGNVTQEQRENENSSVVAVQLDYLRGLLSIRRIDRIEG